MKSETKLFAPIAIVGQSCVLPGAFDPETLWENIRDGRDLIDAAGAGNWRLAAPEATLVRGQSRGPGADRDDFVDRTATLRGGTVQGFAQVFAEVLRPEDDARPLQRLDVAFQWLLYCGRQALADAGLRAADLRTRPDLRAGLILGNLSYPTAAFTQLYETIALKQAGIVVQHNGADLPARENRFMSGLPAHWLAKELGCVAGAFALDAACASSLFALKIACDRLHDGTADVMFAGAVNAADDLFLHIGFTALQALSPSGRSRPFHREADGLVPAQGAALFVLKTLERAERDGDRILGVIRGVGLSNDGRSRGFLAPAADGQAAAMRAAYAMSGLSPADISLIECHATGTSVGDSTEIESMREVFAGCRNISIGSLKSNLGHLITASGAAGLMKVLKAFEHRTLPATLHVDPQQTLAALVDSPFRVIGKNENYEVESDGSRKDSSRRAAVSSFGFGGNNAHLIVEEWTGAGLSAARMVGSILRNGVAERDEGRWEPVAIVGLGARVGELDGVDAFRTALVAGASAESQAMREISLDLKSLPFPPRDLEHTLAQQLVLLAVSEEALAEINTPLPTERTGVFVGMQCDTEIARYGLRWRLADILKQSVGNTSRDGVVSPLDAAGVIGRMPNIPANRLNARYDFRGPGFTVSAEELSGIRALEVAVRALGCGEIDAALVGAVDLSCEPVHAQIAREVLGADRPVPADAAVVFVCKRLVDAKRDGDNIYAIVNKIEGMEDIAANPTQDPSHKTGEDAPQFNTTNLFGHAHAASGFLELTAAVLAVRHGIAAACTNTGVSKAMPDVRAPGSATHLRLHALGGQTMQVKLSSRESRVGYVANGLPELRIYSGADVADLLRRLASDAPPNGPDDGPARLAFFVSSKAGDSKRDGVATREQALEYLRSVVRMGPNARPRPTPGLFFRATPLDGELAFAFTGAASAYSGMGRELLFALPELHERLTRRFEFRDLSHWIGWAYSGASEATAFQQLCGSSYLCQIHADLSRNILGLEPHAVLGLSSGETNSLLAMGVWHDMENFLRGIEASRMYDRELAGEFAAVERFRAQHRLPGVGWADWRLLAPVERVRESIANEPGVRLTIINAPDDCVIGGAGEACDRVIRNLGRELAIPLGHGMAVHCPEVGDFESTWYNLHHRTTHSAESRVRFYSNFFEGRAYVPDADSAARALTGNALTTIDFPRIIERAYADGVRIFVEHGPRGLLSGWIGKILGEREHLAVSFDKPGDSFARTCEAVAQLVVHGVSLDYENFFENVRASTGRRPRRSAAHAGFMKSFPAHPAPVRIDVAATSRSAMQRMEPAPELASVLKDFAPVRYVRRSASTPPVAPALAADPGALALGTKEQYVGGAADAIVSEFARQMTALTEHHTAYLRQQQTLHEQFLALNRRLFALQSAGARAFENNPVSSRWYDGNSGGHNPEPRKSNLPGGLTFTREQLEIHADGRISEIFGDLFRQQDEFACQVRMPKPPLLLADRVTGLDAEAGSMQLGTVWTETDVRPDAWYLNAGRMPAGVMIESGQADLFLISYLGVDFLNRGQRVYRLLGCELTYYGRLPAVGDTLRYDIHVDGHAAQGDIRLFFFHYDCRIGDELRLSVRNGQAGFFTDAELAESGGVLWDATTGEYNPTARLDPARIRCTHTRFSREQLRAFSEGDLFACFGPGFEYGQTHVRSPKIQSARMLFLDEVTDFDPRGGPWGRGYLRARSALARDDWYFDGHFKNDPCMPGTLMFEGCLQAMAFYIAGLGYTIAHDGWLFEPVPDETYKLLCRGQATPDSREIVYEVFVEEVHEGPMPVVFADLLCTIDGLKAFHARRMGLRLVPDWPLTTRPELLANYRDPVPVAQVDGMPLGYASLLACAWGPPSDAFGEMYRRFDGPRTVPRLPGPPYHFMSRVTQTIGAAGEFRESAGVVIEYDIPSADEWYFSEGSMPFAVLLEAALQPCGWLASYVGSTLTTDEALFFRNLDGAAVLKSEIMPASGVLRTHVTLTSISQTGPMIIQSFDVRCFLNDAEIYEMQTVFGFFPAEALANQVGMAATDAERARIAAPSDFFVELTERPARYFRGALHLPDSMLCMLDRVTGCEIGHAAAQNERTEQAPPIARLRGEKDVRASEWFFKAHFFQDPVQPGSLGLEALLQLLQFYLIHENLAEGIARPKFESIQLNEKIGWKYRGQVVPGNKCITSEVEVLSVGRDERGVVARAQGWLWVDGKRIYHFTDFGLRIVEDELENAAAGVDETRESYEFLDPQQDLWLQDHCPTYTVPVLPMMGVLDRLAGSAPSGVHVTVKDLTLSRWISFAKGPLRLRRTIETIETVKAIGSNPESLTDEIQTVYKTQLAIWREAADERFSRFDPVASARVEFRSAQAFGSPRKTIATEEYDFIDRELPYSTGAMFHGPAFQYLVSLREDATRGAATALLDADAGEVPYGNVHQGLLDAGTHIIPADRLHEWSHEIAADQVGYPARILRAEFFEALPRTGVVRVDAVFQGLCEFAEAPGVRHPVFQLQWIFPPDNQRIAVQIEVAYALFPKGPLGATEPERRRVFLRDRKYVPGVRLARYDERTRESTLAFSTIQASDWLAGTVATVYKCAAESPEGLVVEIAAKDLFARLLEIHPAQIAVNLTTRQIHCECLPYNQFAFEVRVDGAGPSCRAAVHQLIDAGDFRASGFHAELNRDAWREMLHTRAWPGEPLIFGLIQKFVRRFVLNAPDDFRALRGESVLYLGNHQIGIESILFAILAGGFSRVPLQTVAKIDHRHSYVGRLIELFMSYPGVHPPESIIYFDEEQPASFLDHLARFQAGLAKHKCSLMVHAEGARAYTSRHEVKVLSQVLVDFAVELNFPIVPVWFAGGLPVESTPDRIEFPYGYGSQDIYLGHSISPGELRGLNAAQRVARVLAAINTTGPETDGPNPRDQYFAERVGVLQSEAQIGEVAAVMRAMLELIPDPGPEISRVLKLLEHDDAMPAALESAEFPNTDPRLHWMRKLAAYLTER